MSKIYPWEQPKVCRCKYPRVRSLRLCGVRKRRYDSKRCLTCKQRINWDEKEGADFHYRRDR